MSSSDISETTPLLNQEETREKKCACSCSLWFLVIVFTLGFTIGTYLLITENKDWPPMVPLYIISRSSWGSRTSNPSGIPLQFPISYVLVLQSGTKNCYNFKNCTAIVRDIQNKTTYRDIPDNYLIGGDRCTYEGQGRLQSLYNVTQFPDINKTLVISILGNFTTAKPNKEEIVEAQVLISESLRKQYLDENYQLFGVQDISKGQNDSQFLLAELKTWSRFNGSISTRLYN